MSSKILLVDDSDTVLMMEKMILKKYQFNLILARDGIEALDKVQAERPDLILLDIMMPRMTGIEVCKKIRENPEVRDTPIIMVTTRGEQESINLAFQNGCDDYVTKPIKSQELLAKMKHLMKN